MRGKCLIYQNKEEFKQGEKVMLKVKIKNIKKINVRVFEVNTENYYLKNENGDFSDIQVDSLIPFEEYIFDYDYPSMMMHEEQFEFSSIEKKNNGVFIVELIGEEKNSKAIIKKGGLNLICDNKIGRECVVMDKQDQTIKDSKMYINKKLFTSNENGIIMIPKDVGKINGNVIIVSGDYAELANITIQDYDYKLKINSIFNLESLRGGNKAKIVIQSQLLLNNQNISLSLCENVNVNLNIKNDLNVKQSQNFNDVKLRDDQDLELEFNVPVNMKELSIELKCEFDDELDKKKSLNAFQQKFFDRPRLKLEIDADMQQRSDGQYILYFFGLNGEEIKDMKISIDFQMESGNNQNFDFLTDDNGMINLGELKEVERINIRYSNNKFLRDFNILSQQNSNYSNKMIIHEDEEFELIINQKENDQSIYLSKLSKNDKLLNEITNYQIIEGDLTKLKFSKLDKGSYRLYFNNKTIDLLVQDGKILENLGVQNIINENEIINYKNDDQYIIGKAIDYGDYIELQLQGDVKDVRVHLMMSNYKQDFSDFGQNVIEDKQLTIRKAKMKNSYFSERRLHDELIYVYNRKKQKGQMGITLEKPGMILKRNKLGETTESKVKVQKGENFADAYGGRGRENLRTARMSHSPLHHLILPPRLNLLRESYQVQGKIICNQIPENGKLIINKQDFENYSNIQAIIVTNKRHNIFVEIKNKEIEVRKNDERLKESKSKGFIYKQKRKMVYLDKMQEMSLDNYQNKEISFIDDMNSLFNSILVLDNNKKELKEWKFLTEWEFLSPEEKLKKYDKYVSHELNYFIKLKDPLFFEGVVFPFISNKKEKTLMDYYLLDNEEEMKSFANIAKLDQLKPFEVAILIHGLRKDEQLVQGLCYYLEMKFQLITDDEEDNDRKFDSLLNSQLINNAEVEIFEEEEDYEDDIDLDLQQNNFDQKFSLQSIRSRSSRAFSTNRGLMRKRRQVKIFKPQERASEFNERKYYFNESEYENNFHEFWFDIAKYLYKVNSNENFFSHNFINALTNPTDAIIIMAMIDLPFQRDTINEIIIDDNLKIISQEPIVILIKEIIKEEGKMSQSDILVSQRFFDINDKFQQDEKQKNVQVEKPIKEFVKGIIYESSIVITNPTSNLLKVNVISEIPQGSISFRSLQSSNIKSYLLKPLESKSLSFEFYFPESGNYDLYPATVVRGDEIMGIADISDKIVVKENKMIRDMESFTDILGSGNLEKILKFIEEKNILNQNIFKFQDIYWLLQREDFYYNLIEILKLKGVFDYTVWSYSIKHNDLNGFKDLLMNQNSQNILKRYFLYMNNEFVDIDQFEVKEYYPLVNPRAHRFGDKTNQILNKQFQQTYKLFLNYLFEKDSPSIEDKILLTNYLILQDRMVEASQYFMRINENEIEKNESIIQMDYLAAFINLINGDQDYQIAKKIVSEYLDYPVLSWRNLFIDIANQFAEFEEKEIIQKSTKEEEKNIDKAKTQSTFKAKLDQNRIEIVSENLDFVNLKLYKINLEVNFSLNPFKEIDIKDYTLVKPFYQEIMMLDQSQMVNYFSIPEDIINEKFFIEIENLSKEYIPFNLDHTIKQEFGIIKVIEKETKKPVSKIYIKCFAKYKNGDVNFYKDGYTDLRGSFDYVSLNTDILDNIQVFKILISSENDGDKIVEIKPPIKIEREEGVAKQLISTKWKGIQSSRVRQNIYQNILFQ